MDSGKHFLQGLYPLEYHNFKEEMVHHKDEGSPIHDTMYSNILNLIENTT